MMAPGTCGRSRFPDVQSAAVSYGALYGAAAIKAGGSTSDTLSHGLSDGDKPAPTQPRSVSQQDVYSLRARDGGLQPLPIAYHFVAQYRPQLRRNGMRFFNRAAFCGRGVNCMRMLLVGALIASIMGCCRAQPQATLERCTTKGCVQRTA